MSHAIQKFARKFSKRIVLLSCHYDVIDWLLPDWIIDCNKDSFEDRRSLHQERQERITVDVREIDKSSWRMFSKYHYLSQRLPGGKLWFFGAFIGSEQIGFNCFANYVCGQPKTLHSNRTVIHPDYCGLGLGMKFDDSCSAIMKARGYKIFGKFSSVPTYRAMIKNPKWVLRSSDFKTSGGSSLSTSKTKSGRVKAMRNNVHWWSFEYIG